MYKRKGCALWTIERKDFEDYLDWSDVGSGGRKRVSLKNLTYPKELDLLNEFDIILEINNKRYLGYLGSHRDKITRKGKVTIREVDFYICQEDYLKDVEIVREVEL